MLLMFDLRLISLLCLDGVLEVLTDNLRSALTVGGVLAHVLLTALQTHF